MPKFISYPPDLSVYVFNFLNVGPGPSSVFRMRRCDPRFALRGPWASRLASMHSAPLSSGNDGVLAGRAFAGFCAAPLARPMGPEPCTTARVDELFPVS